MDLRIEVELLRLVCRNIRDSVAPTMVIAVVLAWVLAEGNNVTALVWWCVVQIALQLFWGWQMPLLIALEPTRQQFRKVIRRMSFVMAVHGIAWGALAWITVSDGSVSVSIITIAILLSLPGSSILAVSPMFPVYATFSLVETLTLASALWQQPDRSFQIIAVLSCVTLLGFLGHAFKFSRTARATFELRFENRDLIEKLKLETLHAKNEHARADSANQAKSKFLAAASHDLRQPIHAQILFLGVLSGTALTPHQRSVLDHAQSASLASSDMLNTLLDYSRIQAGIVKPYLSVFELQPLLRRIENDLAPLADSKGLFYRCPDTTAVIYSDFSLVEMILRNLISNAIRYTNQGGVLVACRARDHRVVIEVWDTGIGIPEESLEDIFKEFHQLGNSERNNTKGLGLGLSIVDGLSQVLGVSVTVSSRLGRGSVFRLPLPATLAIFTDPISTKALDPLVFANECVLVIDDDAMVRLAMHELLLLWGCENWTASSLEEAVSVAQQHPPTIILSDYRLQNMVTGTEATAAVCEVLGVHIDSLLITGDTDPERLRLARASGVELLHKPVAPRVLYAALLKTIASRSSVTNLHSSIR